MYVCVIYIYDVHVDDIYIYRPTRPSPQPLNVCVCVPSLKTWCLPLDLIPCQSLCIRHVLHVLTLLHSPDPFIVEYWILKGLLFSMIQFFHDYSTFHKHFRLYCILGVN
jgi:hypothetical protein